MADARAVTSKILAGTLMSALVFITFALSFVLTDWSRLPDWWVVAAILAAGVVMHVVLEAIGYRVAPLAAGETDPRTSFARFQSAMFLRFAFAEAVALASLAFAFVLVEGGFLIFVTGAVVSMVLLAVHVWPGRRPVEKTARALEANGTRTPLRELFGHQDRGGAIQEL